MQIKQIDKVVEETEGRARILKGWQLKFVALIAFLWSLFQLWYASPLPYIVGSVSYTHLTLPTKA